jgi:hypothetical protein
MSIRWFKNYPGIIAAAVLLLGAFMAAPPCYAGGAVTIVPDKNQLAPKGSYIPDRRVKEVLVKIKKRQALIEKQKALQQEKQQQENNLPKPQSPEEQ